MFAELCLMCNTYTFQYNKIQNTSDKIIKLH